MWCYVMRHCVQITPYTKAQPNLTMVLFAPSSHPSSASSVLSTRNLSIRARPPPFPSLTIHPYFPNKLCRLTERPAGVATPPPRPRTHSRRSRTHTIGSCRHTHKLDAHSDPHQRAHLAQSSPAVAELVAGRQAKGPGLGGGLVWFA
jgi:hypothetical protein